MLEQQAENQSIRLFYGDETGVSERGYCPYGWQFKDETVSVPSTHGKQINCFGIVSRTNEFHFETTEERINSNFLIAFFDQFVATIEDPTVVLLDNARMHKSKSFQEKAMEWQEKGLYMVYLPPYSPQLNIIERLWLELKQRWLKPEDYDSFETLTKAFQNVLSEVGNHFKIHFKPFNKTNFIKV